tara:strand:+ start:437 stop:1048 length:612 start_codon:yes stop_codon:yes gene_type:complete
MKKILNEWKRFLKESSLSRLYRHMQDHESAALSAFRNEFTKQENLERNRELKAELLGRGYGVTRILGSYIENFETPKAIEVAEESFFVSNRKDNPDFALEIAKLGEDFDQDSVLIVEKGAQNAYLLGTSPEGEFPPYGKRESVGALKMGDEAEFMSRVSGRPYTFKNKEEDLNEELEVFENFSRNAKMAITKIIERRKQKVED